MSFTLPAPAKLNLFLHITGQRDDGYHELQTLFQMLDFGDQLTFSGGDSGSDITISPAIPGVALEDNLIFRAGQLIRQKTGCNLGAHIELKKRLPMGGGLGGGSSDAATALVGLNRLWNTNLSIDELTQLGCQLGADVPVFVLGKTAWAEGIGEKLTPVELPKIWFLVVIPDCHVDTGEIFSNKALTRDSHFMKMRASFERSMFDVWRNDCQAIVEQLHPEVKAARVWLQQFATARMTGTGACVFAQFDSEKAAMAAFSKRPEHLQGFIAKSSNTSMLYK
jgi:4-diphosphocytidyl-2-C-methyl-D-erythritol kinase